MKSKPTSAALSHATFNQLIRVRRDNFNVGDFHIMTDSNLVWLGEQKVGKLQTQRFEIPRPIFNKLLKHYQKQQKFLRK